MLLSKIAEELHTNLPERDVDITDVAYDSRKVTPGALFCCLRGEKTDGHRFARQAVDKGAAALIVEEKLPLDVPQLLVTDGREAMARSAACFFDHPERKMTMLAVTGTNGKTSTTYMVKAVAEEAGLKVGLIGTIQNLIGDEVVETERTTPESADLFRLLNHMAEQGVDLVIMEVSSHALAQNRVAGIRFKAALFTNLTQDHLDYHKTFEAYRAAKKKLFYQTELCIVNDDDPAAAYMSEGLPCPVWTTGIYKGGDFYAKSIEITTAGASFHLFTPKGDGRVDLHISGLFSVYNAMGTAALAIAAGIPFTTIRKGLEKLQYVVGRLPHPGRLEERAGHGPGLCKESADLGLRLRRGQGPRQAPHHGRDLRPERGLLRHHQRQPPDRGPHGHHRQHRGGHPTDRRPLRRHRGQASGHPPCPGHGPGRGRDRGGGQGPRDLSGDQRCEAPFRRSGDRGGLS